MSAVLTGNGFMDNKREALLMLNRNFQREVAIEHAKGICEYFNVKYVPNPISTDDLYKVQIGAFANEDNADDLGAEAKSDGFDVYIVTEDNLYKVQIGAFTDLDNAEGLADQARSKGYNVYIIR